MLGNLITYAFYAFLLVVAYYVHQLIIKPFLRKRHYSKFSNVYQFAGSVPVLGDYFKMIGYKNDGYNEFHVCAEAVEKNPDTGFIHTLVANNSVLFACGENCG